MKVNVAEGKARLSELLDLVEAGQVVTLCRRNVPIAEIRKIEGNRRLRPIGLDREQFRVGPEFFLPLDEDELDLFEGRRS